MKTGLHFNENTSLYWQGHPWHNLLGTTMDWPFSYYVHPFTALLLARCPFFCQSATHLRPKALQGKDNACKITRMQWNKSKQMFLRKCDLSHWRTAIRFSKCNPCNIFPSFQPYLYDECKKSLTVETFLQKLPKSPIQYLFMDNPAL